MRLPFRHSGLIRSYAQVPLTNRRLYTVEGPKLKCRNFSTLTFRLSFYRMKRPKTRTNVLEPKKRSPDSVLRLLTNMNLRSKSVAHKSLFSKPFRLNQQDL